MNWPTTLPNPTTSVSGDVQPSVVRIVMESRRVRQRRKFSGRQRTMSATWELSDAQLQIFENFVATDLNQGADWFAATMPIGSSFQNVSARFVEGKYSVADGGGVLRWRVSAALDVVTA